jgi:enamine deaminase RidA (YjgF/YER057c/UK114 family)
MTIKHLPLLAVALIGSLPASAQKTKQIPLPASQNPSNSDLPISAAVWAGDTLYVSGWLDPDRKTNIDTKSQTLSLIKDIQKFLESQNLTLSDVVMMHVYLRIYPILRHQGPTKQARTHHGAGASARGCWWRFGRNRPNRSASKVAAGPAARGADADRSEPAHAVVCHTRHSAWRLEHRSKVYAEQARLFSAFADEL